MCWWCWRTEWCLHGFIITPLGGIESLLFNLLIYLLVYLCIYLFINLPSTVVGRGMGLVVVVDDIRTQRSYWRCCPPPPTSLPILSLSHFDIVLIHPQSDWTSPPPIMPTILILSSSSSLSRGPHQRSTTDFKWWVIPRCCKGGIIACLMRLCRHPRPRAKRKKSDGLVLHQRRVLSRLGTELKFIYD